MPDIETEHEVPKFGLAFMFCLTGYFAIYLATGQAFGLSNDWILVGFLMASLRLPLIFLAHRTRISIPLLALFFLIPIGVFWQDLSAVRSSSLRFAPPAQWITIGTFYFLCPCLMLYADMRARYIGLDQQLVRLTVDVVLMAFWGAVIASHFLH